MGIEGRTFYDILDMDPGADQAKVSEAFRKLVREHHPDRFKDAGEKAEAERILKEITEAYNTLGKPALRAEYDRSLQKPSGSVAQKSQQEQVRDLVQGGIRSYKNGDFTAAMAMFDHVLRGEPGNDAALYYAGMARLKNPKWRAVGSQQVEKALEINPFEAAYVRGYAEFLLENGLVARAQRLLETAIENHPADERLLALLAAARGGEKSSSGFSLFRKK